MGDLDVLIFTPVYRLEPETVRALMGLEWSGPLSLLLQRDNPRTMGDGRNDGIANHWHQYHRGREAFLRGPYEAMLVIESDIVPPGDTIARLVALEADVAYGAYLFRSNRSPVVNVFHRYPKPARNQGSSLSVEQGGLWDQAYEAGVVDCSGAGLGVVLIQRHVIEAIPFRVEPRSGFCDTPWTRDVFRAGYTMRADCRLLCGHVHEDGRIEWPPIPG